MEGRVEPPNPSMGLLIQGMDGLWSEGAGSWEQGLAWGTGSIAKVRGSDGADPGWAGKKLQEEPCDREVLRAWGFSRLPAATGGQAVRGGWPSIPED